MLVRNVNFFLTPESQGTTAPVVEYTIATDTATTTGRRIAFIVVPSNLKE
jgi:hypothetical protein